MALACGEHHQAHDRGAADGVTFPRHFDLGLEGARAAHELGRGAGVQSLLVGDRHLGEVKAVFRPSRFAAALVGRDIHRHWTWSKPLNWQRGSGSPR